MSQTQEPNHMTFRSQDEKKLLVEFTKWLAEYPLSLSNFELGEDKDQLIAQFLKTREVK